MQNPNGRLRKVVNKKDGNKMQHKQNRQAGANVKVKD